MAFGTLSADLFESASNRSPEPAVLFYATDDDRAGEEAERLIRTAGFEPVKVGGIEQSSRLEVGGDLHDLVVGPAEARSFRCGLIARCPAEAPLRSGLHSDGLDGADHQAPKGDGGIENEGAPATTRMTVGLPASRSVRASNAGRPDRGRVTSRGAARSDSAAAMSGGTGMFEPWKP